jgi:hypothetical protein
MTQEKEIQITNLSQKEITPKPGQTWKAFRVYQIMANDGKTYETTDSTFYSTLRLGQSIIIRFEQLSKSVNVKVYTSYKIITDQKKADQKDNETIEVLAVFKKAIFERIEQMEANIISAIKMTSGGHVQIEDSIDDFDSNGPGF